MKVKVLERFFDKANGILREPGDTFPADEKRAEKLIRLGYVEQVEEKPSDRQTRRDKAAE